MRVLTVTNLYPPLYSGGYEIICQGVVESLRSHGDSTRVLVGASEAHKVVDDEADVHRELRLYWDPDAVAGLSLRRRWELERENAAVLMRHLHTFAPDVVSWWGMGGMSLSLVEQVRRARLPAVAFVCDDWLHYARAGDAWLRLFEGRPQLGRAVSALTRLPTRVQWSSAATYVFISESLRAQAPALTSTAVEHAGIDAPFLAPRPPGEWSWRLLIAGRLDPRKGVATAIEALPSLPEASLTIAGGGSAAEEQSLRDVAHRYGVQDRITWRGPVAREDLPGLYAAHDAVLFPVVWDEPFGLVPLEAMGIGRPVIATGRGGSGEYLRDGENCLLHPAQDAVALAGAVRRLAGDESLRSHLRRQGLLTAGRLTSQRYGRAAITHLERAVAAGRPRRAVPRAAGSG